MKMRSPVLPILLLLAAAAWTFFPAETAGGGASGDPAGTLRRADDLRAEGSYRLARELYESLDPAGLDAITARSVEVRIADCLWRSLASTSVTDPTGIENARNRLEELIRSYERVEDRDPAWAEAHESLGDLFWIRQGSRNWSQAWPHYREVLEWWAGSRRLDLARERYLAVVWKVALPPAAEPYYTYGYYGNRLPLEVLQNALEISRTADERAHASYLLAMTLQSRHGDPAGHRRITEAFRSALDQGRGTAWYDDAIYRFAEWLNGRGRLVRQENGTYRQEPDHVGALELYRRLVAEFEEGESRYVSTAKIRMESITARSVGVAVPGAYLPGAWIEYHLTWRNVDRVDLALYAVDLVRDAKPDDRHGGREWLRSIDLGSRRPERTWVRETGDSGLHLHGGETYRLDGSLPPGAYVLLASAGGVSARDLVLVTTAAVILKPAADRALAYVCDAVEGSPRPGAAVTFWDRMRRGNKRTWNRTAVTAGEDGVAALDLPDGRDREIVVFAAHGQDAAFASAGVWRAERMAGIWKVYAFPDRPAYRPGERVRWKLLARVHDGQEYSTPAGRKLKYAIRDPLGSEVVAGEVTLNEFGAAWGNLTLAKDLRLGEYALSLQDPGSDRTLGIANLFRLEEYRLPEFRVHVGTGDEGGEPRAYRAGETVEAEIRAEYYFGGPVPGAEVQVVVYRKPVHILYRPPAKFPWLHEEASARRHGSWGGPGEIVHQETLRTDGAGRATVRFDTGRYPQADMEFTIEARVTDASRREVTGVGSVRAGTKPYYLFPYTDHHLYRPGDRVRAEFRALDVNRAPVDVEGRVTVTRDAWHEIWLDPYGREVTGDDLKRARRENRIFPPPPPRPGGPTWRLEFEGYRHEEILATTVRTGPEGRAELEFTPPSEGYYRIAWTGMEEELPPVRAETTVWVSDDATTGLGYRPGGVEIILDRDTFHAGERAPVMVTAPVSGSWVLFTVEGDGLYEHRLLHLEGTVRLVDLEIGERHVPNVFLEAAMVRDLRLHLDSEEVVVPPVRHFLEVEVEHHRASYLPGDEAVVTVTTRDADGRPVAAEVAVGVTDASVYAIQEDYAGDPRRFFFGSRRTGRTVTTSSFSLRNYISPERQREIHDRRDRDEEYLLEGASGDMRQEVAAKRSAPSGSREKAVSAAEPSAPAGMDMEDTAGADEISVRTDFRSTAFWQPDVITGEDGTATVRLRMPESLTSWRATARAATRESRFGIGTAETRTQMPLMVRLQAPRFFVAGDEATVSAVLNNSTGETMTARGSLEVEEIILVGDAGTGRTVKVPGGGEVRLDWKVRAVKAGTAVLRAAARAGGHSDGAERSYPVHEHGVEKFLSRSGKLRDDEFRLEMDIPQHRRPGSTYLDVRVTPSLAITMLDALPYLIDYPYGCTEQTMSRFLPAVIAVRTLERLGLEGEDVAGRIFGGIESASAAATHRDGRKDMKKLDDMVAGGLERLADFQHDDGGWGWWKDGDSDLFMTAYVLWGLAVAEEAGIEFDRGMAERSAAFLNRRIVEREDRPDEQAWILHALASASRLTSSVPGNRFRKEAFDNLWNRRDRLNAYTRALLALGAHHLGDEERYAVLVRNLANGVILDRTTGGSPETAHWGSDGVAWRWSEGGVEATAFALRALLAGQPDHSLVEPVINWLVRNRRGAQWSNTRDTAIVVLALTDYLRSSGELSSATEYEVLLNGDRIGTGRFSPGDPLPSPARLRADPRSVRGGPNDIRIRRLSGGGPLYFAVEARFFSLEEPVTAAGNEIFVRREYYRKVPHATLLKGYEYESVELSDGAAVVSGERVEVVLTVEAKNHYEYLVFEDLKPAGLEAVRIRSGEPLYVRELTPRATATPGSRREPQDYTGRSRWVYQEIRDRKVAMFIDRLPQGVWELRYELRAESPGWFHALPALGHAMYVPEIRCNGKEIRIRVEDRGE